MEGLPHLIIPRSAVSASPWRPATFHLYSWRSQGTQKKQDGPCISEKSAQHVLLMKISVQSEMVIRSQRLFQPASHPHWAIQTCHICNPYQSMLLSPGPLLPFVTTYIHTCKRLKKIHQLKCSEMDDLPHSINNVDLEVIFHFPLRSSSENSSKCKQRETIHVLCVC